MRSSSAASFASYSAAIDAWSADTCAATARPMASASSLSARPPSAGGAAAGAAAAAALGAAAAAS